MLQMYWLPDLFNLLDPNYSLTYTFMYLSQCRPNPLSYLSISHCRIIHLGNSDCGWQFGSISQCGYCCPCTNLKKNTESDVSGWILPPLLYSEVKIHVIPNSAQVMINMLCNVKWVTKIVSQTLTWVSEFYFNPINQY